MKVALVHDFMVQMGGAEKVVDIFHDLFPEAPLYTSIYEPDAMPDRYRGWDIRTTFLQRIPYREKFHRLALLFYPLAFESLDLSEYDLVLSSSSAFAKGVITQPHTRHICYTHTPMRFAWSTRSYVESEGISKGLQNLLFPGTHYLRLWDAAASSRVDQYVANSSIVSQRIEKFYRRDSEIIYPPVDTDLFTIAPQVEDYSIVVSRFVPYKRLDLAVDAFTALNRPLKVVGDGRQMDALRARAGKTVEFLGRVGDAELRNLMARAKAFIMPGEEDFGIAPVEANACGRPVIAYAAGGALDTQIDGVTGVLFKESSVESLCDAVRRADTISFDPGVIRSHALQFDTRVFRQKIQQVVNSVVKVDRRVEARRCAA
ncbi:MAG: glycosyltransferase [Armatimonadota bacterium]|nr:glycosyltransferase [Armatimonadota bacterium]